jgi:SagB-type dehydrogenase family enzyme
MPALEVISLGGATEASIWSILYPIERVEPSWKSIPYGKPMCNQRFFVLNERLEPCPVWVAGQLYIGGTGLAKGYWRDEEKTQASFLISPHTGERLYRTGDMGRYLPDGNIEFLGREDFQVKISGHRIELGEIEQTLLQHPAVQAAVVTVITEQEGKKSSAIAGLKQLVAYVVLQSEHISHEKRTSYQALSLRFGLTSIRNETDKPVIDLTLEEPRVSVAQGIGQGQALSSPTNADMLRKYRERLSYRRFLPESLSFKQLSDFLRPLSRIELEGLPKYLYPSAGSIYPVQTYLSVKSGCVEGLVEGVYYYNPELHQLTKLSEGACVERSIHATINQPIFDQSAFSLFLIGDLTAISLQYGDLARDFCLLEAGYMGQLLMMTAAEHHIGLCPVGGLDFGQIRDGFVLGENHVLLHSFLCGSIDPNAATGWSFLPAETEKTKGEASHAATANLSTDLVPPVTTTALHHFLKEKLPEYMLPSAIVVLESLPLNPNGKVDRKNLPMPETQSHRKETGYREPTSEIEQTVADVWQEMLGHAQVGIYDNFFDLGGNSLIGVRMMNRLRKIFEVNLSMHLLFTMPTVEGIAELIKQEYVEILGDDELAEVLNNVSQISEEEARLLLEKDFSEQERER